MMRTVTEKIRNTYFTKNYFSSDFIIKWSLALFFIFGFTMFLTSGLDNMIPYIFGGLALVSFAGGVVLHLVLWLIGSIYKRGFFTFLTESIFIIVGLIVLTVVGGFILYGGAVVGSLLLVFSAIALPEWMKPLVVVLYIIFAFGWYMKGMSFLETT